jgi:flagellar basal-body rod protein FlgF
MENTLLVALSNQGVLRRQMDVIAHNIANMNSSGFKAQRLVIEDHTVRLRGGETAFGEDLAFVRDVASVRDLSEGGLESTGNPFDMAVRGEGWFVVESDAGERYTRNGHFRVDSGGRLVTADGHPVLGEGGGPIVLGARDAQLVVAGDGTVSGDEGEIGRLRIVRFEDSRSLDAVAGGLMASTTPPVAVANPDIVQGMLEGSNVEPIIEMTRMIRVQRAYDSARKLIDKEDQRIKKMVQVYSG